MGALENEARLRKGYEAIAAGDVATVVGLFDADGVLHVGGRGPLHGDHRGHQAIGAALGGLVEWTGGTLRLEVQGVYADDDHGVVMLRESATRARDGMELNVGEAHLFRLDSATGQVLEMWDIPAASDKEAHDDFFA